ncbi:Protein byr4 [Trametes pubescens]|uniref:Protein byr4 n=1 Tax=Trametes pubescens TaxID=154538 RepID=A0A1M2V663_TRAPU|nr:Protein byr4 [Trametes pubescens]
MTTIPAPTIVLPKEEWADADFDFPDGDPIHASDAESDKDDDEDWDMEMDLGRTGGAKAQLVLQGIAARSGSTQPTPHMFTIRPPLPQSSVDEEDDEGVSTIKVAALPKPLAAAKPPPSPIDEDFEDGFALPSDLTTLSLRPLSLAHRTSKSSLEWGDKDQTSSSQSSDAYSTLGFADNSPSSNYTSASLPETETEEDEDEEDILEGLDVPTGLFESGHGAKKLGKILELKKRTAFDDDRVKVVSPDPEDDFEIGLVIDNETELSPSRLLQNAQSVLRPTASSRSKSAPPRPPTALRPPSRVKGDRAKSPNNPPVSSMSQLRRITSPITPPSPPSSNRPAQPTRSQTYSQAVASPSTMTFLAPKPGSLRVQKSHSVLKPPSPPQSRRLGRKASLPSLSESSQSQASGSGVDSATGNGFPLARYETPTASSRAKTAHTSSTTSRMQGLEFTVPPTRPSTPSANPAALRLTMPTSSSRMKSRTPISNVFPTSAAPAVPLLARPPSSARSTSPLPPRPPSATSIKSVKSRHGQSSSLPITSAPKVLKKPKRQRTYGDGTELDAFEDLPTDREQEGKYRVQPKGYGNRVPGASYPKPSSAADASATGTIRRRAKARDFSGSGPESSKAAPLAPSKTLKRTNRIEFPSKPPPEPSKAERDRGNTANAEASAKRKKLASPGQTRRKPTLIRNLGGAGPAKVVGEMKWNPHTLRWEGNDQALRDFDAASGTSTRPALITHLTGSSIGSPVGSFASGARVVGNMIFDPQRMCWISTLHPDEEEPDVFADLADDEDDDDWEARAATIRASQQLQGGAATAPSDQSASSNTSASRVEAPSPARSHTRSMSESESDRCSRASMVCDVDDSFVEKCRAAEERHRAELKGWLAVSNDVFATADRSYLYEIRALATRQY